MVREAGTIDGCKVTDDSRRKNPVSKPISDTVDFNKLKLPDSTLILLSFAISMLLSYEVYDSHLSLSSAIP